VEVPTFAHTPVVEDDRRCVPAPRAAGGSGSVPRISPSMRRPTAARPTLRTPPPRTSCAHGRRLGCRRRQQRRQQQQQQQQQQRTGGRLGAEPARRPSMLGAWTPPPCARSSPA